MIYGYIRVSTDRQTNENQRFEIEKYSKKTWFSGRRMDRRGHQCDQKIGSSPPKRFVAQNAKRRPHYC